MKFDNETSRKAITIQGIVLHTISPYEEGHVLTPNEAAVLNQTLAENLRNNFAGVVDKAIKEAGSAENVDAEALQADFDKYIESYEFGVRRGGGFVGDPVTREARSIATDIAKSLLKQKGHKLADVSKEKMAELVDKVLAKKPEIMETAKRRVEERLSIADASDLLDAA